MGFGCFWGFLCYRMVVLVGFRGGENLCMLFWVLLGDRIVVMVGFGKGGELAHCFWVLLGVFLMFRFSIGWIWK